MASEFFILGLTTDGKQFRPSDWAERLAGVLSCFRPEGSGGRHAHLQFSPYVTPTVAVNAETGELTGPKKDMAGDSDSKAGSKSSAP